MRFRGEMYGNSTSPQTDARGGTASSLVLGGLFEGLEIAGFAAGHKRFGRTFQFFPASPDLDGLGGVDAIVGGGAGDDRLAVPWGDASQVDEIDAHGGGIEDVGRALGGTQQTGHPGQGRALAPRAKSGRLAHRHHRRSRPRHRWHHDAPYCTMPRVLEVLNRDWRDL